MKIATNEDLAISRAAMLLFQHLFFLMKVATLYAGDGATLHTVFQHLFFLMKVATPRDRKQSSFEGSFNTFSF
ncbi:hypothetical protein L8106_30045 [Lyngbya sp. PCC 8106]|nr:hypothetical protein L8106_30045 [Lyngbya sp. PCC 8106]